MTEYRIERVSALGRAYDAIAQELNNSDNNTGKSLEIVCQLNSVLNQEQKGLENKIAREAEEQARKTNQNQVGTYRGFDYKFLGYVEVIANFATVSAVVAKNMDWAKNDYSKNTRDFTKFVSTSKNWRQNFLEAERTKLSSDKNSLDAQNQSMSSSAAQHAQSVATNNQETERLMREAHELAMRVIQV